MLTKLGLQNFKSWKDTGEVSFSPITGFFGANSSGKSSLLQSLLMMKQTAESHDRGIVFHFGDSGSLVDLGDYASTVWTHNSSLELKLLLEWECDWEFGVGDIYGGGTVEPGTHLLFEAVVGCETTSYPHWPKLKKSMYCLPGIGEFGLMESTGKGMVAFSPAGEYIPPREPGEPWDAPDKFYEFPYWVRREGRASSFGPDVHFELPFSFERLMEQLHYLGPLRANPSRVYTHAGAQPVDMGPAGEFVVDALLSSQERNMYVEIGERNLVRVDVHVASWLKRLGMVYDFRLEPLAAGRQLYEVKVRRTPYSPEVLLTDVGFGVSQILPVLTLCYYLPFGSTIIFDHPDMHLHPSVQAGLADVFIDAHRHNGVQIIFESHSEHLLRRLQRRVAEEDVDGRDVAIYFCSNKDGGESILSRLQLDEFGNISNWPKDFFGDQFGEIAAMSDAALQRMGDSK